MAARSAGPTTDAASAGFAIRTSATSALRSFLFASYFVPCALSLALTATMISGLAPTASAAAWPKRVFTPRWTPSREPVRTRPVKWIVWSISYR